MRTTEGVGLVPPRPVSVRLSDKDIAYVLTMTDKRLAARRYDLRKDQWGRGLNNDPKLPILVGLMGEQAFSNWVFTELGIVAPVDDSIVDRGDGGIDFRVCGYKVQVKTARANYDDLLIRTRDVCQPSEDNQVPWDVCVRVQWPQRVFRKYERGLFGDNEPKPRIFASLNGIIWRDGTDGFLSRKTIEKGKAIGEFNYCIKATDLLPMSAFADRCRGRINRGMIK